ncbi:MAG: hypothetical protein JSR45_14490 [Proteobacteria bacterium]|nr:hypothetical protein [Pseudomonadota bacterium]
MFKPAFALFALGLVALPALAQEGPVATQHRTTSGVETPPPAKPAAAMPDAQAPAWKRRRYPDLGFSAEFPVDPRRQDGPPRPGKARVSMVAAQVGDRPYIVLRADMTGVKGVTSKDPNKALDDTLVGRLRQGEVLGDHALPAKLGGGRELIVKQGDATARIRIYSHWPRFYALIVAGPADAPQGLHDPDADRFMGSFARITKK